VWEPCTLPHTRQSPPAPTLVLHAAAAPPCRLLLLPMLLLRCCRKHWQEAHSEHGSLWGHANPQGSHDAAEGSPA
jgi:hypothetical protein